MSAGTVFVVDDDEAVRDALGMLFRTAGLTVETYDSALAFLRRTKPGSRCCLVLDIRMPGVTGTVLHDELIERGWRVPVVFITGHGDIPMAVAAMRKGAYDFIEKPFDDSRLLGQVLAAIEHADKGMSAGGRARERLGRLSEREQQVLDGVLEGKSSREIAAQLAISVKTVEFHRARIMHKLGVRSVAELFRECFAEGKPLPERDKG